MTNEILGYSKTDSGQWEPIIQPRGYVYTAAFILCQQCKDPISSHGGPRYNSLCIFCYERDVEQ
jgi:hypothetical protein